jgi:hypothetical protein
MRFLRTSIPLSWNSLRNSGGGWSSAVIGEQKAFVSLAWDPSTTIRAPVQSCGGGVLCLTGLACEFDFDVIN